MKTKVFIDGSEGTTGLRIIERFKNRNDIELLRISPELSDEHRAAIHEPSGRRCQAGGCHGEAFWVLALFKSRFPLRIPNKP